MAQPRLHVLISCPQPGSRLLDVSVLAEGRGEGAIGFSFPRWVPGSYLVREPFRHVRDLRVLDERANPLSFSRKGMNAIRISARHPSGSVLLRYRLLCPEMSVRSNHLDASHLHMMPPFTWFLPDLGCEWAENDGPVSVTMQLPERWSPATQLICSEEEIELPQLPEWGQVDGCRRHTLLAIDRDELLDGVVEANANDSHTVVVNGIPHHLRIWDAGGKEQPEGAIERLLEAIRLIAEESHALFGPPDIPDYTVILHLTSSARGGLEHLRSQTSMVHRTALWPGEEEGWRDLVSLLSHEYIHLWNVKDLRPTQFLNYNLDEEVPIDLLWWFEGGTSWLGDIICIRCGVWSQKDYFLDFKRKYSRHLKGEGNAHQSLAESSHESWIHLYRGHPYSTEHQISYYNEGELALFCLDAELRRRSKGEGGLDDLFALLWRRHQRNSQNPGIKEEQIRSALAEIPGGSRLGTMLTELVHGRARPPLQRALKTFGLHLSVDEKKKSDDEDEHKPKQGWLGIGLSEKAKGLFITRFETGSPLRDVAMPNDELVSVDEIRINSSKLLKQTLKGRVGDELNLLLARQGVLYEAKVTCVERPDPEVVVKGEGNRLWKGLIASKIPN